MNFGERHLNLYQVNLSHSFFNEILFKRIVELSTVDIPNDSSEELKPAFGKISI
jgi:hypothetical protein